MYQVWYTVYANIVSYQVSKSYHTYIRVCHLKFAVCGVCSYVLVPYGIQYQVRIWEYNVFHMYEYNMTWYRSHDAIYTIRTHIIRWKVLVWLLLLLWSRFVTHHAYLYPVTIETNRSDVWRAAVPVNIDISFVPQVLLVYRCRRCIRETMSHVISFRAVLNRSSPCTDYPGSILRVVTTSSTNTRGMRQLSRQYSYIISYVLTVPAAQNSY